MQLRGWSCLSTPSQNFLSSVFFKSSVLLFRFELDGVRFLDSILEPTFNFGISVFFMSKWLNSAGDSGKNISKMKLGEQMVL